MRLGQNLKFIKFGTYFLAAGLLVFLLFFFDLRTYINIDVIQNGRVYLFSKMSFLGSFISEIKKIKDLTQENILLKDQNRELLSKLAFQAELEKDNEFLRQTLGLDNIKDRHLVEARIYNIQFTPEGHTILLNKGVSASIKKDGIVISSYGILIGRITEVLDDFSIASLVSDPDIKVTVRLLENSTAGIARGIFDRGIQLDFISQNDEVAENNTVITSGNDLFPSGLVVGRVRNISSNDGSLFKKIEVEPEFKKISLDRVLILMP